MTESIGENEIKNDNINNHIPPSLHIKHQSTSDLEEKIDYIYKTLKRQRKIGYFKFMLRVLMIVGVIYFMIYLPPETKGQISQKIQEILSQKVSQISQPIIDQTLQNIEKQQNSQELIDSSLQNERVNQLLEKYKNSQSMGE